MWFYNAIVVSENNNDTNNSKVSSFAEDFLRVSIKFDEKWNWKKNIWCPYVEKN